MKTVCVLLFSIFTTCLLRAETRVAVSCSASDVRAAVAAAADGDTVVIPEGTCTWNSASGCSGFNCAGVVINNKRLHLKGSGVGKTVITHGVNDADQVGSLSITGSKAVEVSDFTIKKISRTGIWVLSGMSAEFSLHDLRLEGATEAAKAFGVFHEGTNYGVIYGNYCQNTKVDVSPRQGADADASWSNPTDLGSGSATYVEDNTFYRIADTVGGTTLGNIMDANNGGRYVFRHNTIYNSHVYAHTLGNNRRAPRKYEVYDNTFITNQDGDTWVWIMVESATGVIFNNKVYGPWGEYGIGVQYQRACTLTGTAVTPWNTNSKCAAGLSTLYDGAGAGGYPCKDQPGRGMDAGITTTNAAEPIYVWNNRRCSRAYPDTCETSYSLIGVALTNSCANTSSILQVGRDIINNGSTPKTGYAAYPYPHPSRGGMAAPTNLRVVP